ncbi:hypothetical protein ESCO_001667 [Escovopsis weberi]|uniref:Uncharacterized protein n=1 Tax=Escovopsis weberi TaxID=150374 RepID=A0A0N0RU47_ESCWE|nr:hypothetical protein ESCO_001667 [Escovopsis weberi]
MKSSDCLTPKIISTNLNTEDAPPPLQMFQGQEHFPQAGKILLVRTRGDKDLVLEQAEVDMRVSRRRDTSLGVAWHCIKSNNWLGFRNTVSGHYLQRPDPRIPKAQGADFSELAWFVVERHQRGGTGDGVGLYRDW